MDPNVRKYRAYTRWLESLPPARERGSHRAEFCIEPWFHIDGHGTRKFVLGQTGGETKHSVIASLETGRLLKARVFEPLFFRS